MNSQKKNEYGITYFNNDKFKDALKYICKRDRCTLAYLLRKHNLYPFYNVYVLTAKSVPGLKVIADVCYKLRLNPLKFVYTNEPFNSMKDTISKHAESLNNISARVLNDFKLHVYKIYDYLSSRSSLDLSLVFLPNDHAVIFYKNPEIKSAPILAFHLIEHYKKLYALHDRISTDINQLYKEYNSGYAKVNKELLKTYLNMLYIENLAYQKL